MNVYRFLSCICCMASIWLRFVEHKFKEARSASFQIFQFVFDLIGLLGCMSRVWIRCDRDPSLFGFFLLIACMAA